MDLYWTKALSFQSLEVSYLNYTLQQDVDPNNDVQITISKRLLVSKYSAAVAELILLCFISYLLVRVLQRSKF